MLRRLLLPALYLQVGDCLIDLIGGSGGLPYVDDTRYNKQRRMIDDFVPNKVDTELALQERKKEDVLHRKHWNAHNGLVIITNNIERMLCLSAIMLFEYKSNVTYE